MNAIADFILFLLVLNPFYASTRCYYHIWKNYCILDSYMVKLSVYVVAKLFKKIHE